MRTNNGWEFVKHEFEDFCPREGIQRHKTVSYTPQQNSLAERMNKTILERVRYMLLSANLPKSFWGEAVNTTVYLSIGVHQLHWISKSLKKYGMECPLSTNILKCLGVLLMPMSVKGN